MKLEKVIATLKFDISGQHRILQRLESDVEITQDQVCKLFADHTDALERFNYRLLNPAKAEILETQRQLSGGEIL